MIDDVSSLLGVLLWIGGVLILVPLTRARHDRSLRYLAAVLVVYAASRFFDLPGAPATATSSLLLNLLVLASSYCEVCFFRTVVHEDAGGPPPRLGRELAVALAVAVVAVAAWILAPAPLRSGLAKPANLHEPAAFVFLVVLVGYYVAVSARAVRWSARLLAAAPRGASVGSVGLARRGFVLGVAIIGVAELIRLVADVGKIAQAVAVFTAPALRPLVEQLYPLVNLCIRFGHTAFFVGVLVPIVADAAQTLFLAVSQRRDHAALEPLHRATTAAFPDITLTTPRRFAARHYRRDVEIRDCLVLLEPFYDRAVADRARDTGGGEPEAVAALVTAALRARRAGRLPEHPHPLPVSGATTRDADTAWLVAVARAFAAQETAARASASVNAPA